MQKSKINLINCYTPSCKYVCLTVGDGLIWRWAMDWNQKLHYVVQMNSFNSVCMRESVCMEAGAGFSNDRKQREQVEISVFPVMCVVVWWLLWNGSVVMIHSPPSTSPNAINMMMSQHERTNIAVFVHVYLVPTYTNLGPKQCIKTKLSVQLALLTATVFLLLLLSAKPFLLKYSHWINLFKFVQDYWPTSAAR